MGSSENTSNSNITINNYSDFWNWFQQHADKFHHTIKMGDDIVTNFFEEIHPILQQLGEDYFYLAGMLNEETAELVLTAEGRVKNIVFLEELVNAAPPIKGWKFTALKPALKIEDVTINMDGIIYSKDNISFYSNDNPNYPDLIDITLVHNDYSEENQNEIMGGCYIFLDNVLGELNLASIVDNITFRAPADAEKELVPIEKLNAFLIWRQKEFIEKYDAVRHSTEDDSYSLLEGTLQNGLPIIAVINKDLFSWDAKTSHPWMLNISIEFDGSENNGMPDKNTYQLMEEIEDEIVLQLNNHDGCISIGRQTCDGTREIYFACNEFRKPSKIIAEIVKKHTDQIDISYDIFKDKYWMSMGRYGN